jgi:NADH dehydrogenase
MPQPKRILILGGGFGGVYSALELQKRLKRSDSVEVLLVNRDNFFLFTPMLHEVAASDLDITTIVNPLRKLLKRVHLFTGDVEKIDLHNKIVTVWHGDEQHTHEISYDHLILGLGCVTNFYDLPGVADKAMTMKSLGDAIGLRNRIIGNMEEADFECCSSVRRKLLTFVVAGGGFAGVETAASINDFIHEALPFYRNLKKEQVRVVLVHSGQVILPELSERLGLYAQKKLGARGVDIRLGARVAAFTDNHVRLSNGDRIETCTMVWTAGTSPHPLISTLQCKTERGRICVDEKLCVPDYPGVWSLGDCAVVPDIRSGKPHPPTAQHAIREARTLAQNIVATLRNKPLRPFKFRTIGQLASLGHRTGVAQVFGWRFSGFIAWWMWRTIYLSKLPRFEKKFRVALDWTLDLLFSKDLVQFQTTRGARLPTNNIGELSQISDATMPVHEERPVEVVAAP